MDLARRAGLGLFAVALLVAGCAGAAPSATPAATPRPTPTPDPHLTEPASVDTVLQLLARAGVRIQPNNASTGPDGEPVKRVNATYAGWPLQVTQFSSSAALRKAAGLDEEPGPRNEDAAYVLVGLNILVEYGPPIRSLKDPRPEEPFRQAAAELASALDPLLGPLEQRSLDPLPIGREATATAAPEAHADPTPAP